MKDLIKSDDKVNMALHDIIKPMCARYDPYKYPRPGYGIPSLMLKLAACRDRLKAARLWAIAEERRGARSEPVQRRGIRSDGASVSAVNNAATRRFVKNLVNKTLQKMRAKAATAAAVVNRRAIRADAAIARVNVRSRGIRKRVVKVPSVIVRRPRIRAAVPCQIIEEEKQEPVIYQAGRVVKREPRPVRPVAVVRACPMLPVRRYVRQPAAQLAVLRQRRPVLVQQLVRASGGFVRRNQVFANGGGRQNQRANVIYVNEEMSSRVQPSARSGVRFVNKRPNPPYVYEDEVDESNRRTKRKGRGLTTQYDY
ncbi:hypothetical protein GCK32_006306 [Trichostrongylus colubriformis]|uniref:Uncharacterized protein n=1 Tax=Trichostrongylus colubriformis TaxID=6319 RepID=A0AAN8EZ92_TRICO